MNELCSYMQFAQPTLRPNSLLLLCKESVAECPDLN